MNTYTPIFGKIVDSSLWRESDLVVKVYLTMLAKKDMDHVVRANAYMIGEWAKKTEKEALEAIKVLSSPDRKRIEPQPHEGRRIKKVEDGWLILNGQYYEDMARDVARKFRKAKWEREKRAKEKAGKGAPTDNRDDLINIHEKHASDLRRERDEEGVL
jgi:hypothetical protein